eukprot:CAMPEP_0172329776 /NCGR_PEP_ID=MMETSP1058-20130122/61058_1 /TAXON_ID=83371 /ORGANISM="Detonula confervacea, Strain CCMP 353" /LENGTH=1164 /DNA_ID=CAMNT_0013046967 /DNA_START=113 /DNA_END=3608 /DNA_ORIENTATION=-
MAKKALLLVLSFTVFFYIVGYSGGVNDAYVPPNAASKNSYNRDSSSGLNKKGGGGYPKESPKKLVLPPGGEDEQSRSSSAGLGGGRDLDAQVGGMRDGDSVRGEGYDQDPFRKVFEGNNGESDGGFDRDRGNLNLGAGEDSKFGFPEDENNDSNDRSNNARGDTDALRYKNEGGDGVNWSAEDEAPPSRDEPRNDDGIGGSRLDQDNSNEVDTFGGGLLRGVNRSGKTQSGDLLRRGHGQDGSADKSAGFTSDRVGVDAYKQRGHDGSDDEDGRRRSASFDGNASGNYRQKADEDSYRGMEGMNGNKNTGASRDSAFHQHQGQMAIPRAMDPNGDGSTYKNRFQTNVSGDVKKYLRSINGSPDQKDILDDSEKSKGSGDVAYQKPYSDAKERSGDASYKKQYSDAKERSGDVSYKKKHTNSERHSTYKKTDEDIWASKSDDANKDSKVKPYLKSNRDSSDQKDILDGSEKTKGSGDVAYKKQHSDAKERYGNVAYKKEHSGSEKYSTYKKRSVEDAGESKKSDDATKDSSDVKVKGYLKSKRGSADRDDAFGDREKTKGSGNVAYKDRYSDAKDRSGDVAYKKKYSGLEKDSTYKKRSDEDVGESKKRDDATMDSSDIKVKEYLKSGRDQKRIDNSEDSNNKKYLGTKKHSSHMENINGGRASKKDQDLSRYSGTRKHPSYKKNIDEVGASIKESDAAKDSSDVKKYLNSDTVWADQKPIASDDKTKNPDDFVEEKRYSGTRKKLSSRKNIDEVGASIKKSDAIEDSSDAKKNADSDKASTDQRDMNSGEKMKDSGDVAGEEGYSATKKHSSYNRNIDEVGALSKKDDATKGSGDVKKVVDSENGSSDQPVVSNNKGDGSIDSNDSTDQKSIENVGASKKKSDATKDPTDVKKNPDSGDASSDQKKINVVDEIKNSDDVAEKKSQSGDLVSEQRRANSEKKSANQKSADEAQESAKNSDVVKNSSDEKNTNSGDVKEKDSEKASTDQKNAEEEPASLNKDEAGESVNEEDGKKKASTDQKNAEEEPASLNKESDATKNSSDVTDKDPDTEKAPTDQKNIDEAEESVKTSGLLSKLRKKKKSVDPADKEINGDEEKGPKDEKDIVEAEESVNEEDGKKKGLVNKFRKKKKKKPIETSDNAKEEGKNAAQAKLDLDKGQTSIKKKN